MIVRGVYLLLAGLYLATIDGLSALSLGLISISGALSLFVPYVGLLLIPLGLLGANRSGRPVLRGSGPVCLMIAFAAMAVVSAAASPFEEAVQNAAVFLLFASTIAVGYLFWEASEVETSLRLLRRIAIVGTILSILSMALGVDIYGVRAIGAIGLLYLSLLLPYRGTSRVMRVAPFLIVLALILSLSRTALVIGVVSLLFLVVRSASRRRVAQLAVVIPAMMVAGYWVLFEYAPVRDRFLGGDAALLVGGVQINTSGRVTLWSTTFQSAMDSPFLGNGAGSSAVLLSGMFNSSHPHNDYLRVFHDFGMVGFVVFAAGLSWLLWRTWRAARRTDLPVHWTAFIALATAATLGLTDNVFVYSFVMMPIGLIVGMSLSVDAADRQVAAGDRTAMQRGGLLVAGSARQRWRLR